MPVDLAELRPEAIEAADARALELLGDGRPDEAVSLLRGIVHRAVTKHGEEDVLTGMAQSRLADMLRRTGAPEAEQLGALTDAIKAFSASVGPTDPQTTSAFARLGGERDVREAAATTPIAAARSPRTARSAIRGASRSPASFRSCTSARRPGWCSSSTTSPRTVRWTSTRTACAQRRHGRCASRSHSRRSPIARPPAASRS